MGALASPHPASHPLSCVSLRIFNAMVAHVYEVFEHLRDARSLEALWKPGLHISDNLRLLFTMGVSAHAVPGGALCHSTIA